MRGLPLRTRRRWIRGAIDWIVATGLLESDCQLQVFQSLDHVCPLEAQGSSYGVQGYAEQLVAAGLDQEGIYISKALAAPEKAV